MAAPNDGRASPLERHRHGCRLGVVQYDYVSRADPGRQRPGVMVSSPVEGRELVDPEDASIAWLAMQLVVKALGHPEELGRTAYHHPSHVDPRRLSSKAAAYDPSAQLHRRKRSSSPPTPSFHPAAHRRAARPQTGARSSARTGNGQDPRKCRVPSGIAARASSCRATKRQYGRSQRHRRDELSATACTDPGRPHAPSTDR